MIYLFFSNEGEVRERWIVVDKKIDVNDIEFKIQKYV